MGTARLAAGIGIVLAAFACTPDWTVLGDAEPDAATDLGLSGDPGGQDPGTPDPGRDAGAEVADPGAEATADPGADAAGDPGPQPDAPGDSLEDAGPDAGGGCIPGNLGECRLEGEPIPCGTALATWFFDSVTSPRDLCLRECADGRQAITEGACVDGYRCGFCIHLDVPCDACCNLPDTGVPGRCSDDACIQVNCDSTGCTHRPWEWIGQACTAENDFGACPGKLGCTHATCSLGTVAVDCGGQRQCDAPQPGPDGAGGLPGVDDDCDGTTDETDDGVLAIPADARAEDPALAALDDGRFVVAWWTDVSTWAGEGGQPTVRQEVWMRTGSRGAPLGGTPVLAESGLVSSPDLVPLAGGRFAVTWGWQSGFESPTVLQRLRVLQGPADPPILATDLAVPGRLVAGPGGERFAVFTAPGGGTGDPGRLQWWHPDGPDGAPIELAGLETVGTAGATVLPLADGTLLVAGWTWGPPPEQRPTVGARWYAADGQPLGDAFPLDTATLASHSQVTGPFLAALSGDRVLAAWGADAITTPGTVLRVREVPKGGPATAPVVQPTLDPAGAQEAEAVTVAAGRVTLGWRKLTLNTGDLFATELDAASLARQAEFPVRVQAHGDLKNVRMGAWADGARVALWTWEWTSPNGVLGPGMRLRVLAP